MSFAGSDRGGQESSTPQEAALLAEINDLKETLDAIRSGGVDAVMIPGPDGGSLYTLTSADRPYRVLVEQMGDGAATLAEDGTVLYTNQRFADLIRAERASLLGRDLAEIVQANNPTIIDDLLGTAPGMTAHHELALIHPDAQRTPVLASATGLDLDGTIVRCLIVTDLTRRVEAEEQLRLTMEYAPIGLAMESPHGRFVLVNPALCRMLGRDAETLQSMTWKDFTHPDDIEITADLLANLIAGNAPSYSLRKRYLKPDGSVLWGDLSVSAVRNDDGSVRNVIAQIVDVTEQVQATQMLAESKENYRLLAENASDVVLRQDPDRRIKWASGSVAGVLGWGASDLVEHVIDEFVHPDDLPMFGQLMASSGPGGSTHAEFRFRRADGTYRWVAYRTRLKADEAGNPVAVVGGLVDIASRKAGEAKEQERLDELERFKRLTVGRELKMIALKKELEHLKKLISDDGTDRGNQSQT